MNLHQLRIFRAVARHGSFSAAARELFLTQPAVSLQVRSLEQGLGVKLFDRSSRSPALTEAGQLVLRGASTLLETEDELRRGLDELRGASRGKILLGTNTTGGMYVLPAALRAFRQAYPDVELILDVDEADHICERVNQRMLDFGFVGGPVEDRRLVVEPLVSDQVILIASPDHPLSQSRLVALSALVQHRFIVPSPKAKTRLLVERRLHALNIIIRPAMQLSGADAIKKAVSANLGIAFVSARTVELELDRGDLCRIEVPGMHIERQLELVYREAKYFTPVARRFHQFLRESAMGTSLGVPLQSARAPTRVATRDGVDPREAFNQPVSRESGGGALT